MNTLRTTLWLATGTLATGVALAHPGHESDAATGLDALRAGLLHPWSGIDHLLAMVAVGMWAAQGGRRTRIGLPLLFPVVMVLGGLAGRGATLPPQLEWFIALSVLALGSLIALQVRWPLRYGAVIVGAIALAHGYAHGAELPGEVNDTGYFAGFATATLLLHAMGIGLGLGLARLGRPLLPTCGGGIALVGLMLLVSP